jgi:hypothetical protein
MDGPGFEGKFEIGFMSVPDPYEPGKERTVPCNLRHDVVLTLYRTGVQGGRINHAQYVAGNRFLGLLEAATECRGLVCDPAKEPVDGGRGGQELSDHRVRAVRELKRLSQCLDLFRPGSYHFARSVLETHIPFRAYGYSKHKTEKASQIFKTILTEVARHFHLENEPCRCGIKDT